MSRYLRQAKQLPPAELLPQIHHSYAKFLTVLRRSMLARLILLCCRMGAAFFSGAAFSACSGMSQIGGGGANPFQSAFSTGVLFALLQGALYKVWQ